MRWVLQLTIPRWQPTTTEANGNCAPPQPIARSPAASVPTGVPTCSPPSAPLSELPHAEASTPIRPSTRPYAGSPFSNRVEQIQIFGVETPLRCSHASSASHQDESIAHLRCR